MKKLLITLTLITFLGACVEITSTLQDMEMLQKKYKNVYRITELNYVTFDSLHTYHVKVNLGGEIESTIKIK
jgi:hypothetical protein